MTTKTTQTRAAKTPRPVRVLIRVLGIEQTSDKSVELRGFEPLTFCMPCRRATSCAIAPQPTRGRLTGLCRWNAASIPALGACVVLGEDTGEDAPHAAPRNRRASLRPPVSLIPVSTDPHLSAPTGKPRARSLGLRFRGTPGTWNAITDVPGVEVGYQTLIEGTAVSTGVTAIHPCGKPNPGNPVAAGSHSQNGDGGMTGVSWIEESGTLEGPVAITNTHVVGIAHAGIVSWMNRHHPHTARR
jgi:hypothetical protein